MQLFTESLTSYKRLPTLEVKAGDLLIGNNHPVRIQTMTTSDTMDTIKTVEESIRCIEAGAELVRITAPSKNDAENLLHIKNELRRRGYFTPLVADIHFTPNAAEIAARIVEKVRINPGNYADKKKFETIDYTDGAYTNELERIRNKFVPLISICKQYGTAMRIGTNHGSLSDRIMSRYGDTANGMVESAMEFLRIAESENYYNIVLSMKSSNPIVMVEAYRLLIMKMQEELGHCYPLHLGVTEAGDGEDGRIKSAIGIGTLLEDGIGDTIRVSLTEDAELELPVCKNIIKRYEHIEPSYVPEVRNVTAVPLNITERHIRKTNPVENTGDKNVPVVVLPYDKKVTKEDLAGAGYKYDAASDKWNIADMAVDYIFCREPVDYPLPGTLKVILEYDKWLLAGKEFFPLMSVETYVNATVLSEKINFILLDCYSGHGAPLNEQLIRKLQNDPTAVLCLRSSNQNRMQSFRRMFIELYEKGIWAPCILICESRKPTEEEKLIDYAIDTGSVLIEGFGNGIWLSGNSFDKPGMDSSKIRSVAFGILQASRTRISKTEYISCPSCGRTLFDLQETTAKIRAVTNHLKGVKIAVMGCIVNGPGEMADADFGYVGSGPGKITLYKGKDVVKRNIPSDTAVAELIQLLKENGAWVEPPLVTA